jgi:predicted nucleic acid-binding protein
MSEPVLRVVDDSAGTPATLIDSCILLDIATEDATWADWAANAVAHVLDEGRAVINPLVFAEVSVGYSSIEELDHALPTDDFERETLPYEAGFLAGKAFLAYRKRGGTKRSPLPDFYIGAHAAVRSYRLLTRDTARFRTYFPTLDVMAPP